MSKRVALCDQHSRYVKGCVECRARNAAYRRWHLRQRAYGRVMTVPALGLTRRLRALAFLGWPQSALARETGLSFRTVQAIRAGEWTEVRKPTADAVKAAYERLCMTAGPDCRSTTWAKNQGWLPPLAYDDIDDPDEWPATVTVLPTNDVDEVAVERAMCGERIDLTPAERVEAIRRMSDAGDSLNRIADALGMSIRRVRDLKERHHLTSTYDPQRSAS